MTEREYPSAEELVEALRAEALVCELDLYEDLAESFESETNKLLREHYARWYREIIGVHPSHRGALRQQLDAVIHAGDPRVADVVKELGGQVSSRFSSTV